MHISMPTHALKQQCGTQMFPIPLKTHPVVYFTYIVYYQLKENLTTTTWRQETLLSAAAAGGNKDIFEKVANLLNGAVRTRQPLPVQGPETKQSGRNNANTAKASAGKTCGGLLF